MNLLDEVKKMKQNNISEDKIIEILQQKGVSYRNISDLLSQSKIKAAVEEPDPEVPQPQNQNNQNYPYQQYDQGEMQESMMQNSNPEQYIQPQEDYKNSPMQTKNQQSSQYSQEVQEYQPYESQQYGYDYQQSAPSSEMIAEISEQIVAEKLDQFRKKIEKIIDFKTVMEAKTESIEERLKRIENIINTLQTSVLKKVGDYITNTEDIKKELIQTQRTFASVVRKSPQKTQKSPIKKSN